MRTNNENRRGRLNSDASRDGKSFDKPGYHSDNKGKPNDYRRHNERKPYGDSNTRSDDRKPYGDSNTRSNDRRPYGDSNTRSNDRRPYGDSNTRSNDRRPYGDSNTRSNDRRPYGDSNTRSNDRRPYGDSNSRFNERKSFGEKLPFDKNRAGRDSYKPRYENRNNNDRPMRPRFNAGDQSSDEKLTFRKASEVKDSRFIETRIDDRKPGVTFRKRKRTDDYDQNAKYSKKKQFEHKQNFIDPTKPIRLNKFLANAGISSRREADEYIEAGVISVNGEIVTQLGSKVLPTDKVLFHNQPVRIEQKIYLLLNKPKDCVTTVEDTHARKTVMDIVRNACSERIYPIGRLDRNTTGLLLLTNDGELATKLTHPKYEKKKIYHVTLEKNITQEDFDKITQGINLGDFTIKADALEFVKENNLTELGIEIHSGQNRVVRRIFDSLGYKILKLDRVYFAGLTKKNLPRGKYRFLAEREISMLKMGNYE